MASGSADGELEPVDAQPAEALADGAGVGSSVEQGGEQHVAGDPADAVEMEEAAQPSAPAADRAIRAAIVPAPRPSSMLTTATPAAQLHSIESSAVTPPRAAP